MTLTNALLVALSVAALVFVAVLLADGVRTLLARRRAERAARPLQLVVAERREDAGHLVRLVLADPRGRALPAFAAGQHVLLKAPAGPGGRPAQRAYSLAAWTARPRRYELGIKREAQGQVSGWVWQQLAVGSRVEVSPPRGDFVLDAAGTGELVLIGGGIGITPMRAMAHAALASTTRSVILFHAARHAEELLYREEFRALAAADARLAYRPVVSRPTADWSGERGRLDAARVLAPLAAPPSATFYLCAGTAMMDELAAGLIAAGIASAHIRREAFGVAAGAGSSGERIVVAATGGRREFLTAGEPTLLAALEAHDLAPPSECRAGTCGECRMRVVDGEVRWLAKPETALADGEILPCVCAAVGGLTLAAVA